MRVAHAYINFFPVLVGGGQFLEKSTKKWCGERPRGGRKLGPAPAIGHLEERAGTDVFESLLQEPDCWSWKCLPYGRRTVAPRTISVLIFLKNSPPPIKIECLVTCSPLQILVKGSATRGCKTSWVRRRTRVSRVVIV